MRISFHKFHMHLARVPIFYKVCRSVFEILKNLLLVENQNEFFWIPWYLLKNKMDGQDCIWEAKWYKIGHARLESHYVIKSDLSRHIPLKEKKKKEWSICPRFLLSAVSIQCLVKKYVYLIKKTIKLKDSQVICLLNANRMFHNHAKAGAITQEMTNKVVITSTRHRTPHRHRTPLNPQHFNINMHIPHNVFYTFPEVAGRRISLTIKSSLSWWSFPLLSRPSCLIQGRNCKERLDDSNS